MKTYNVEISADVQAENANEALSVLLKDTNKIESIEVCERKLE